jgi:hypothetical protein
LYLKNQAGKWEKRQVQKYTKYAIVMDYTVLKNNCLLPFDISSTNKKYASIIMAVTCNDLAMTSQRA